MSYPRGPPSPTCPTPLAPSAGHRRKEEELGPRGTWASLHFLLESHYRSPNPKASPRLAGRWGGQSWVELGKAGSRAGDQRAGPDDYDSSQGPRPEGGGEAPHAESARPEGGWQVETGS